MHRYRKIICNVLTLLLIAAGLPVFCPQDIDHDGGVDLKDAVLSVRQLAKSAEHPEQFESAMRNTLTAIRTAAGLQTVIKADGDSLATAGGKINNPALISLPSDLPGPSGRSFVRKEPISFISHFFRPEFPPPKNAA